MKKVIALVAAAALVVGAGVAIAQSVPKVTAINSDDLFQDIPHGIPSAQSKYATAAQVANYAASVPGGNPENVLVGGDFAQNLWQDGTTSASTTTTLLYGADQWFQWSGTGTAFTTIKETAAADITQAFGASARVQRTAAQTGVIPVCIGQEVESSNAYRFQGQTAEFDFHALAGANFSAASSNLNVSIVWGTGTDEGATKLAFQFNAGGGGSSTWAGQTNAASNLSVPITTGWNRYTVAAAIPVTATEIAVIICYTPVGTAGAADYFEFTGAQLVRNSALTPLVGTTGVVLSPNDVRAKSFSRRLTSDEQAAQYYYYYRITESSTAIKQRAMCAYSTTSIANCKIPFPVSMRIVPTMTYATGFESCATTACTSATACTALTTSATLTGNAASQEGVIMNCASTAGFPAAGTAGFLWDVGTGSPTGAIKASARF